MKLIPAAAVVQTPPNWNALYLFREGIQLAMKWSNISHSPHDSLGGNYFKQSDLVVMRYLLTDGPRHRDLADSLEPPVVTGADGDDGISTLFIDKAEMRGWGWPESALHCWLDLYYEGLMEGSRGVLLC